jgi:hypothetical protein
MSTSESLFQKYSDELCAQVDVGNLIFVRKLVEGPMAQLKVDLQDVFDKNASCYVS